jgi:hypothetical protein
VERQTELSDERNKSNESRGRFASAGKNQNMDDIFQKTYE